MRESRQGIEVLYTAEESNTIPIRLNGELIRRFQSCFSEGVVPKVVVRNGKMVSIIWLEARLFEIKCTNDRLSKSLSWRFTFVQRVLTCIGTSTRGEITACT